MFVRNFVLKVCSNDNLVGPVQDQIALLICKAGLNDFPSIWVLGFGFRVQTPKCCQAPFCCTRPRHNYSLFTLNETESGCAILYAELEVLNE